MNKVDWFELWYTDKQAMLETMIRVMVSDLNAGYNYFGECITKQREYIDKFKKEFEDQLMAFHEMDEGKRNRWCYYDLLRKGAISIR